MRSDKTVTCMVAGVLLSASVLFVGCGGGDDNPAAPSIAGPYTQTMTGTVGRQCTR